MALTDEEYQGKDLEIYKKLYALETLYYRIKLMINPDNILFEEFSSALDESISLAREVRTENSVAELFNNGLRTPEKAIEISNRILEFQKKELNKGDKTTITIDIENDKKEKIDIISEAIDSRNDHLKKYLSAVESLVEQKEKLVTVAQKYLIEEKQRLLSHKKREGNEK